MGSVSFVCRELFCNRNRLIRLARYERASLNKGTALGALWNLLNPGLQIFIYWFVFSVGLRVKPMDDGTPYVVWMMTGLLPWFTINGTMMASAGSVFSFSDMLKTMNIPLSLIPAKCVVKAGMDHLWTMGILLAVILLCGVRPSPYMLEAAYYMAAMLFFLLGFALLASSVNVVFQDFQKFLGPCLRFLFYVSSVVWPIERLPRSFQTVLRLNPLTYVIDGYRGCLLYGVGISASPGRALAFWGSSAVLFAVGCALHLRLRKRFIDIL